MASPMMTDFGDHTYIKKKYFAAQYYDLLIQFRYDRVRKTQKTYVHYHIAGSYLSIGQAGVYSKEWTRQKKLASLSN